MDAPRPSVQKTAVLTLEEASRSTPGRWVQTYTTETATSMADRVLRPCTSGKEKSGKERGEMVNSSRAEQEKKKKGGRGGKSQHWRTSEQKRACPVPQHRTRGDKSDRRPTYLTPYRPARQLPTAAPRPPARDARPAATARPRADAAPPTPMPTPHPPRRGGCPAPSAPRPHAAPPRPPRRLSAADRRARAGRLRHTPGAGAAGGTPATRGGKQRVYAADGAGGRPAGTPSAVPTVGVSLHHPSLPSGGVGRRPHPPARPGSTTHHAPIDVFFPEAG